MKRNQFIISGLAVMSLFAACNNHANEEAKQRSMSLSQYVDSVEQATPVYTVSNWSAIDNGYQQRAIDAEKEMDKMEAADKERAEASKAKYAALKLKYEAKFKEKEEEAKKAAETPNYRQVLRSKLFGEGKIGTDMKFGFVTGSNIKEVYEKFVNTVADNRNSYTREDWDEIKVLYESLDSRKNEVEKDLSTGDNLKIAALKVKFAAIKSVERPAAKAEENEKAKD